MEIERKTIDKDLDFLRQISEEVDLDNDNYMEWIEVLREYVSKTILYALAPVQIGIPKRMIYFKNTSENTEKNYDSSFGENEILINPNLISAKGCSTYLEGCDSCYPLVCEVNRPYSVDVEYYDINGNFCRETFQGLKATIFCHEYDHLNGILHIDRSDNIIKMNYEERKEYRKKHPYKVISKTCEYNDEVNIRDKEKIKRML